MRGPKRFARRADEIALERFLRRERDRVEEQIEPLGLAADFFEKGSDLLRLSRRRRDKAACFAELADEFLDVFLQALALIIENQARARRGPSLGDRPGDAAFIRDAEDDAGFACENLFCHNAPTLGGIASRESPRLSAVNGAHFRTPARPSYEPWRPWIGPLLRSWICSCVLPPRSGGVPGRCLRQDSSNAADTRPADNSTKS